MAIVNSLGNLKATDSAIRLGELLFDDNETIALSAATALGHIKSSRAIPLLLRALDSDKILCAKICWALGEIGSKNALSGLEKVWRKRKIPEAIAAIRRIEGQKK